MRARNGKRIRKEVQMKIVNDPFPAEGDVGIFKVSVTYTQQADCNSDKDEDQYLTISTQDSPGSQPYYFELRTDKWSFDDAEELNQILNDFIKRLDSLNEERKH